MIDNIHHVVLLTSPVAPVKLQKNDIVMKNCIWQTTFNISSSQGSKHATVLTVIQTYLYVMNLDTKMKFQFFIIIIIIIIF